LYRYNVAHTAPPPAAAGDDSSAAAGAGAGASLRSMHSTTGLAPGVAARVGAASTAATCAVITPEAGRCTR
jgi:hypothetical protein